MNWKATMRPSARRREFGRKRLAVWLLAACLAGSNSMSVRPLSAQTQQPASAESSDTDEAEASQLNSAPLGIRVSRRTTYLTEPLDEDGLIDYVAAMNAMHGKGITAENNAAVAIWQVAKPDINDADELRGFYERLGLEVPDEFAWVSLSDMGKREQQAAGTDSPQGDFDAFRSEPKIFAQQGRANRPWTAEQSPELAEWMRLNEEPAKALHAALQRPHYFVPFYTGTDPETGRQQPLVFMLLPDIHNLRDFARFLHARSSYRVAQGDVQGAISDTLDCYRLGRLTGQHPTLIGNLVGIAIQSIAAEALNVIVQHGKLSARQCREILKELDQLPEAQEMVETIHTGERFFYLDSAIFIARGQNAEMVEMLTGTDSELLNRVLTSGVADWNVVLEMGNQWYDRLVRIGRMTSLRRQARGFREMTADIKKFREEAGSPTGFARLALGGRKARGEMLGNVFLSLLAPALEQALNAERRTDARWVTSRIGLALTAYHADHGGYPDQLDALVPDYLPEIGSDPYTAKPLKYVSADDGFLVYSVGADQQDNQGASFGQQQDDVPFRVPMVLND